MNRSTDRILTTHVGSLPRPPDLIEAMVAEDRGEPVETRHKRILKRRRDGKVADRSGQHILAVAPRYQAALDHCLGQLLYEQWYAVGLGDYLVEHFVWQW